MDVNYVHTWVGQMLTLGTVNKAFRRSVDQLVLAIINCETKLDVSSSFSFSLLKFMRPHTFKNVYPGTDDPQTLAPAREWLMIIFRLELEPLLPGAQKPRRNHRVNCGNRQLCSGTDVKVYPQPGFKLSV